LNTKFFIKLSIVKKAANVGINLDAGLPCQTDNFPSRRWHLSAGSGQDVHGPLHPALLSDEAAYQASLKKLLDLDADLLLEGHFGVYRGRDSVPRFISSFTKGR